MHNCMPYDSIQGQGHGGLKVLKLLISKSVSFAGMHVIKRITINCDTPEQYLHCVPKTCDYIFYNNFNNKCPITIIFGIVSSKSMCHRKMVSFPTSPI